MIRTTVLLLLCCNNLFAQNDTFRQVHIGFCFPLSTNGQEATHYTNGASFHALAGVSGSERAFCFAGISNVVRKDANGLVFSGIANHIGENARGIQFAGVTNIVSGSAAGLQCAGFNNVCGAISGCQMAGFSNIARGTAKGVQLAGFINVARNTDNQFSGFMNVGKQVSGVQSSGFCNVAKDVDGVQLAGFINVARKVKGAQLAGFINIADSCDYPIALINIIRHGEQYIGAQIDESGTALVSFRSGSKKLYGILGAGVNTAVSTPRYGLEGGLGMHLSMGLIFRLKTELAVLSLSDFKDGVYMKSTVRVLPSLRVARSLELFAGPAIGFSNYPDRLGELHTSYLWSRRSNGTFYGVNVGGLAGIQVRL